VWVQPWNTGYMLSGDIEARMDPYFPFEVCGPTGWRAQGPRALNRTELGTAGWALGQAGRPGWRLGIPTYLRMPARVGWGA